ncbi:MAG: SLC13 family permease, partial [Gammaproteobacteria bacterium]
ERHPGGTVVCFEGDEAHDFYIVKAGELEIAVSRGGDLRETVALIGPEQWFGERALFADRRRSATVTARTDVELWRLTKEKFDGLIEENPWLILHFTQELSDRLYGRNQELSKIQAAFNAQVEFFFNAQPEAAQRLLLKTSVLHPLDATAVTALTGDPDAPSALARLARETPFVVLRDGVPSYPEAIRDSLQARLALDTGAEGVRALHAQAAAAYLEAGQWSQAMDHLLAADAFAEAAALLDARVDAAFLAEHPDALLGWLNRFPATDAAPLSALRERLDDALHPGADADSAAPEGRRLDRLLSPAGRRWAGAILGVAGGIGIGTLTPFDGLDPTSMQMLGLLAWAVVFWVFDVLPDFVVGIGLILGWILLAIVPSTVAVSGFTTSPFFLIIGVLGMTASLQSSGILFRLALHILKAFPLTYRGQALGLSLSGTGITTCIPDTTAGTAIAGPIILALSDSLGYRRRSRGSAGLAMAALLGFGQMSPFFLTGAAENLLAWSLLPEAARAQITWGSWLIAALPLGVTTFVLAFVATMLKFPPEFQPTVSRGLIETQIEALGPLSRAELINAAVVVGAMAGWISAPVHGVDVAWIAMIGLGCLLSLNLLDRVAFRAGINWDFLFYLGAVLSLTSVVRELHVDAWVIDQVAPRLQPLAASPGLFLLVTMLAVFAARFILPSFPLVSLLTLTIVPIAMEAGIAPLPLILVICTGVTVWFLPYQSTCYLALYFGTREKAFSHAQVRGLAWIYGIIYLAAVAVSIPVWRALG